MLQRFKNNAHHKILFTDEKIFSVEKSFNKQNDRIYAQSSEDGRNKFPRVQRGHHPERVVRGISYNHVTPIHFCEKGFKTSGAVYRNMLDEVVEPLNETLFVENAGCFNKTLPTYLEFVPPKTDWKEMSQTLFGMRSGHLEVWM